MAKIMSVSEAVKTYIQDGATITFGGFVGSAHPEEVSLTVEQEFLATGHPNNLTLLYCAGMGDGKEKGLNHFGHEGLVSKVIGGHWGLGPSSRSWRWKIRSLPTICPRVSSARCTGILQQASPA